MPAPAEPGHDDFRVALAAVGADVPASWLIALLRHGARWLLEPGSPSPVTGRPISPHAWALLVFQGLVATRGGRAASIRGRALAFDLAAAVTPIAVRGTVARRAVSAPVQKALWVNERLAGMRSRDGAAACLLALES